MSAQRLGNSKPVNCGGYFLLLLLTDDKLALDDTDYRLQTHRHRHACAVIHLPPHVSQCVQKLLSLTGSEMRPIRRKTCFTFGVLPASSGSNNCSHSLSRPPRAPVSASTCQLLIQRVCTHAVVLPPAGPGRSPRSGAISEPQLDGSTHTLGTLRGSCLRRLLNPPRGPTIFSV